MSISLLFLFQIKCDKIASIGQLYICQGVSHSIRLGKTMKFYHNLYIGDTIEKPEKIKRKLKKYAKLNNIWLIVYVESNRQLEIYHCIMLQQYYYKDNPPYVIGIAGSKEEASQIICRIAEEAVHKTGKADLPAYLFAGELSDMTEA